MQLLEHEWLAVMELLLNVYKAKNEVKMRRSFLQNIRLLIPYSKASFYLADFDKTGVLTAGLGVNFAEGVLDSYPSKLIEYDYGKWIFMSSESKVYRTSEWFPENMRESSLYYLNAFRPNNIHFEVRLPLFYNGVLMGFTALFRTQAEGDFSDRDLFILGQTKNFLAYYLHENVYLRQNKAVKETIDIGALAAKFALTPREKEIFGCILAGKSSEKIAKELCISQNTQKKHMTNIYKKMGVCNRNELYKVLMDNNVKHCIE